MADVLTADQRHRCMSRVRSKDTKPEILLRKALWKNGFRYRVNITSLPGSPDIVLPKYRTVIFIHGCFWHGHKNCKNASIPKTNTEFWEAKISRNQQRDQEVWRQLEAKDWCVIIVWECELKKAVIDETIIRVEAEIRLNGERKRHEREERKASRIAYLQERKAREEREAALKAEIEKKSSSFMLGRI